MKKLQKAKKSWQYPSILQRLMFLAMLFVCTSSAFAQKQVSGTVVDEAGEPVIGASVIVKGTSNGTVTDFDGNFSIQKVPENGTVGILIRRISRSRGF